VWGPFTGNPQPLSVGIQLAHPFYYNPASGNLLLDIKSMGGPGTSLMDASDIVGDSLSSVSVYGADLPSGLADSRGVATVFIFEPVPEPSTIALLAGGLLGLVVAHWKQRAGKK